MADNGSAESVGDAFGLEAVRELLQLIRETDVTEIQIERGTSKLHIKRGPQPAPQGPVLVTPSLATALQGMHSNSLPAQTPLYSQPGALTGAPAGSESEPTPGGITITAPMVGTYYSSPSPKDPAYVQEGDHVQPDDVVGIVEAMKIMNEIVYEGETGGRIVRLLVKNGQPVEYGQPLMVVEPE